MTINKTTECGRDCCRC